MEFASDSGLDSAKPPGDAGGGGATADNLVSGHFWHDRRNAATQEYPYFKNGIKKRIRHFAGGLLRPFKKNMVHMEERYMILKKERLSERADPVKIIYIYECNKSTKEPLIEKGPIKGCMYKLENLYLNIKDNRSKDNSTTHHASSSSSSSAHESMIWREFTLYFRGESSSKAHTQRDLHKLVMWFRDEDQVKRNKWADEIQRHRLEIKAEIDAEIERGIADQTRPNVPYYMITHDDRRSSNPEITYVAAEIFYEDFVVTQYCKCSGPNKDKATFIRDCHCMDEEFKEHIQKKVRQYTENLKSDEPCHLMIEERMALSKNPQFQVLAGDALKYTLELVRVDGVKSGFSIGNHEYVAAGPYEGIHYLYGFKLNPEMFEKDFLHKPGRRTKINRRYELTFKLPGDKVWRSFQTKLDNLGHVNLTKTELINHRSNTIRPAMPGFRPRGNTAPGNSIQPQNRPSKKVDAGGVVGDAAVDSDSIELREMSSATVGATTITTASPVSNRGGLNQSHHHNQRQRRRRETEPPEEDPGRDYQNPRHFQPHRSLHHHHHDQVNSKDLDDALRLKQDEELDKLTEHHGAGDDDSVYWNKKWKEKNNQKPLNNEQKQMNKTIHLWILVKVQTTLSVPKWDEKKKKHITLVCYFYNWKTEKTVGLWAHLL